MVGRITVLLSAVAIGSVSPEKTTPLEVIRVTRCDGGRTDRVDLPRLAKNYKAAKDELSQALSRMNKIPARAASEGYDSGLPEPARRLERTFNPSHPLPEKVRGAMLYVVTVDRNGIVRGLPQGGVPRTAVVLVARAARLKDCNRLTPFTLLTPDLAARLGFRSAPCQAVVSPDGREVRITEGGSP